MDIEEIKKKVVTAEDGTKSLEIEGGGKIVWNHKLFAHYRAYRSWVPSRCDRKKHASWGRGFSYTAFLDLEVPPTAFFQQAYNSIIAGTTIPVRLGIARCNAVDQFCKAKGREIATKDVEQTYIQIHDIKRNERGNPVLLFGIAESPENGPIAYQDLAELIFAVTAAPGGKTHFSVYGDA